MALDIHNFLARNFRGPDLAGVDQARSQNALMQNQVQRLPQINRQQDLAIRQADQGLQMGQMELDQAGQKNALGIIGRGLSMIRDKNSASQIIADPSFQSAAQALKLPPMQITPEDTDEGIMQQASALLQAIGAGGQQYRVQSSQILEDGTIALVGSDGSITRTGEKARNPMQIVPGGVGGAPALVDRTNARVTPISTPQAETEAAASRAAATTTATTTAQAEAERQNVQNANTRTLGVWQVARQGLVNALKGTETGPLAGRVPAVTAGQQIAEGAVAAVAPVLKQLFRSAGEGVFTDRDQQLLLDMIPKRTDHPESAVAKIQMIDAIIEAKLSAGAGALPAPQVGGAPGAPGGIDPSLWEYMTPEERALWQ